MSYLENKIRKFVKHGVDKKDILYYIVSDLRNEGLTKEEGSEMIDICIRRRIFNNRPNEKMKLGEKRYNEGEMTEEEMINQDFSKWKYEDLSMAEKVFYEQQNEKKENEKAE